MNLWSIGRALAGLAVVLLPSLSHAQLFGLFGPPKLTRVSAHTCDVYADTEKVKMGFKWYWAGPCAGEFANGQGWLVEYVAPEGHEPYNPHTVYSAPMRNGRMADPVQEFTDFSHWTDWSYLNMVLEDGWPLWNRGGIRKIPRYMLPEGMQEALNTFAAEVPIPGYIALAVQRGMQRCPGVITVLSPSGQAVAFDVRGYIAKEGLETVKKDLSTKMIEAELKKGDPAAKNMAATYQLIATAVVGCS